MASDGVLNFDTKIDLSGIEKGLADIRNVMQIVAENVLNKSCKNGHAFQC